MAEERPTTTPATDESEIDIRLPEIGRAHV
jgi:hypothetical protein